MVRHRRRMGPVNAGGVAVRKPSTDDPIRPERRFPRIVPVHPNLTPGVRDGRPGLRHRHRRGFRAGRPRRQGGDEAVTAETTVGLVVAVALLGYLVLALIFPERF
ncbi:K+-transporting ATPase, F subunit [Streptomyces turgidiscabies Car8]|uniref:K+-transporting ATPase, F subunit n=1 Tax=Streptomyces turgidiscabies (strain Car8) TaxID=698760 RepID=L7EVX9_STRT8|nr:K+-transporting ATPase, F subunit [Streptomyces turgidiscabies Car8]